MPINEGKLKPQPSSRKKARGYRCLYRAFLRACGERDPLDVLEAVSVGGNSKRSRQAYLNKLRNGAFVEKSALNSLATELGCEASHFIFVPEDHVPRWDGPAYRFAIRVAQLLEDETIPLVDPDTGEAPDVVRYAWEMGDPELDSMRLTFKEQREAFVFLRDYLMLVVERPTETQRQHPRQLGVMVRGATSKDDLIADIRARKATSLAAFDTLEESWDDDNRFHIQRIRTLLPRRFEIYLDAVELDGTQWECANLEEPELSKRRWTTKADSTSMALVRHVIDTDFHLRRVIFPTYQQDVAFASYYSRSRQLIERMHSRLPDQFPTWWNQFRERNDEELREFVSAWAPADEGAEPRWDSMREALKGNLKRTEDEIWEHYPDTLLPKSKRSVSKPR